MKLVDTPNPNAKKIELDTNSSFQDIKDSLYSDLMETEGVLSVFFWTEFYNNYKRRIWRMETHKSRHL